MKPPAAERVHVPVHEARHHGAAREVHGSRLRPDEGGSAVVVDHVHDLARADGDGLGARAFRVRGVDEAAAQNGARGCGRGVLGGHERREGEKAGRDPP